jgi:hypothetical protein
MNGDLRDIELRKIIQPLEETHAELKKWASSVTCLRRFLQRRNPPDETVARDRLDPSHRCL